MTLMLASDPRLPFSLPDAQMQRGRERGRDRPVAASCPGIRSRELPTISGMDADHRPPPPTLGFPPTLVAAAKTAL